MEAAGQHFQRLCRGHGHQQPGDPALALVSPGAVGDGEHLGDQFSRFAFMDREIGPRDVWRRQHWVRRGLDRDGHGSALHPGSAGIPGDHGHAFPAGGHGGIWPRDLPVVQKRRGTDGANHSFLKPSRSGCLAGGKLFCAGSQCGRIDRQHDRPGKERPRHRRGWFFGQLGKWIWPGEAGGELFGPDGDFAGGGGAWFPARHPDLPGRAGLVPDKFSGKHRQPHWAGGIPCGQPAVGLGHWGDLELYQLGQWQR